MRSARLIDWMAALALCGGLLASYYLIDSRGWFVAFAVILGVGGAVWLQRRTRR